MGFIAGRLIETLDNPMGYDVKQEVHVSSAIHGFGHDTVFHLGSRVGSGESHYRPVAYTVDNVVGTAGLLEALEREGTVQHMVLASSVCAMVGGSPYAATKACQEDLCAYWCERNGVTLSILRLYNVYGPGQALDNPYTGVIANFARALLAGESPTVFEDGLQIRDFVHVDDVVRAMTMAADKRFNGICEIGTGQRTHVIDVVNHLREVLGGPLPTITGEHRQGDVRELKADTRAALNGFRWQAQVGFQAGIAKYAESLRGQKVGTVADATSELRMAGALK